MVTYNQETEVKIYLADFAAIKLRLDELGADLLHPRIYERNVRYDTANKSLTASGLMLRLREDDRVRLTYKGAGSIERGIVTRDELEVQVSDFETMDAILGKLGYMPTMFYEKYRTTYELESTEIVLDELPFGNFIEVEGHSGQIEHVLRMLGLQEAERRHYSYARLFDFVKHHLELNFRDLSFDNFADIDVPENAFIPPGSIVIK